jgi:hypothetical protein
MGLQMIAAQLDGVREKRIRELEQELGCLVVALHPETQLADLSKRQAERVAAVERELGVSLVAYESTAPFRLARPSRAQQKRIEMAEKETGLVLIAYEVVQETAAEFAVPDDEARPFKLSEEQFRRLQMVEQEVGLTLMAYESSDR